MRNEKRSDSDEERAKQEAAEQEAVNALDREFRLEAYRQKYLNFRHFDILRWQVPGLAFLVGGALLSFGQKGQSGLPPSGRTRCLWSVRASLRAPHVPSRLESSQEQCLATSVCAEFWR
jgi:hypothetical protein